jgi:hypothetical protein
MYRLLFFLTMGLVMALSNVLGSGGDRFELRLLEKLPGDDRVKAEAIMKSARTEGMTELRKTLSSIPGEKSDEILISLLDHPSDAVVAKVAEVLATRKKKIIAEGLCNRLERSSGPVFGGTERAMERAASNRRVELSLQEILGRTISSDVPLSDRLLQYSKAIATLK